MTFSVPTGVDAEVVFPRPPDARDAGVVEDDFNAVACMRYGRHILQIALMLLDAELVKLRIVRRE